MKGSEADEAHLVIILQRRGDGVEYTVHCLGGITLRQSRLGSHDSNELLLIHFKYPLTGDGQTARDALARAKSLDR